MKVNKIVELAGTHCWLENWRFTLCNHDSLDSQQLKKAEQLKEHLHLLELVITLSACMGFEYSNYGLKVNLNLRYIKSTRSRKAHITFDRKNFYSLRSPILHSAESKVLFSASK